MSVRTFAALNSSFAARCFPSTGGQVSSLSASADASQVGSIEAAAVRGFNAGTSKLVWVKANSIFFVAGEPVAEGDYLQVIDGEASGLIGRGMAAPATDDEVAAAQKKAPK